MGEKWCEKTKSKNSFFRALKFASPLSLTHKGSGYSPRVSSGSLYGVSPVKIPSKCWGQSNLVYSLECISYSVQCIVCIVKCIVYSVQCMVYKRTKGQKDKGQKDKRTKGQKNKKTKEQRENNILQLKFYNVFCCMTCMFLFQFEGMNHLILLLHFVSLSVILSVTKKSTFFLSMISVRQCSPMNALKEGSIKENAVTVTAMLPQFAKIHLGLKKVNSKLNCTNS